MNDLQPNNTNKREPLFVDMLTNESPSDRIVIYKDDTHERKREHFYWESRMDKNGNTLHHPFILN